jgi:hypothetical protein
MWIEILVFLFLTIGPAYADSTGGGLVKPSKCLSKKELLEKIQFCSDNDKAVHSAKACYQEVISAWNQANGELQRILSVSKKVDGSKQHEEFTFSEADYRKASSKLKELITFTKSRADLLAEYPRVMMDDPMVLTVAGSLPCYQNAFAKIEKLVQLLDDKAAEGIHARSEAKKLARISDGFEQGTESVGMQGVSVGARGTAGVTGFGRSKSGISSYEKNYFPTR